MDRVTDDDTDLAALGLPARPVSTLAGVGCRKVGHARALGRAGLLSLPGVGGASVDRLERSLGRDPWRFTHYAENRGDRDDGWIGDPKPWPEPFLRAIDAICADALARHMTDDLYAAVVARFEQAVMDGRYAGELGSWVEVACGQITPGCWIIVVVDGIDRPNATWTFGETPDPALATRPFGPGAPFHPLPD